MTGKRSVSVDLAEAARIVHDTLAGRTPCLKCWERTAVAGSNSDPAHCMWCEVIEKALIDAYKSGHADGMISGD